MGFVSLGITAVCATILVLILERYYEGPRRK